MTHAIKSLLFCGFLALEACTQPGGPGPAADLHQPPPGRAAPAAALSQQQEASLFLNVVAGLVKQEHYDAALAFLDDYALKQKAPEPRYWLLRGDALTGMGRGVDAAPAYAQLDATSLAPEGWNGKGRVEAARSRWLAAEIDFRKAIQLKPAGAEFLNNLAFCELQLGRNLASVQYLRQAYELEPSSDLMRNNLIVALTLAGDGAGADGLLTQIKDTARREQVRDLARKALFAANEKKRNAS